MGGSYDSVKALKGIFSTARYMGQMGCEIAVIKGADLPDLRQMREQGQLLRGDFLDAFGRLETAVMQYIGKTDVKAAPGIPFSQKLTALAKARDRFRNPKRLDVRIAAIRELLPVRADIVHSALEVTASFDGRSISTKLQFQNASDAGRPPLALTADQLSAVIRRLNQLAAQFSQQRLREAAPAAPAFAT
ncbi:hypothetical protein [Sphingopyxis panaciterrae]